MLKIGWIRSISFLIFLMSMYVFSRFTVDDAFISWRYGFNFVEFGIFNYNPSEFDLTQAYTNPIFAFLSIIPAYLSLDVVLFFKLISLFSLLGFIYYLKKQYDLLVAPLLFLALPASMIHVFSGLETFWFVIGVVLLYESLRNNNIFSSIVLTILLFLIRPESFLLSVLVPIYYLSDRGGISIVEKIKSLFKFNQEKSLYPLLIPLALFFILFAHRLYFGSFLPNTFYIKSVENSLDTKHAILFSLMSIPAIISVFALIRKENTSLFYLVLIFELAICANYSLSSLKMNYAERFLYHIYAPLYFILLIEYKKDCNKDSNDILGLNIRKSLSVAIFVICSSFVVKFSDMVKLADYYPRTQLSHSMLGYAIKDSGAKSMTFGDAGMTAFNADIDALDNIGLGSSLVSKFGVTSDVIDKYEPDVILFHSHPEYSVIPSKKKHGQSILYSWAMNHGFNYVCDSVWRDNYAIAIYIRSSLDKSIFNSACTKTEVNLKSSYETISSYILPTPWKFWNNEDLR
ncbi:hypothetical protein [Vibrio breoganii]|uniref:hypothetical protein n=1 Tax=Vibrio breoganii TaxID=553239 RepID=UPI000C85793F|nr:hypothetical protein [Vibrio breoganii]PMG94670.1 hypothetical protein BCU79_01040 [Vibrio breoganii]